MTDAERQAMRFELGHLAERVDEFVAYHIVEFGMDRAAVRLGLERETLTKFPKPIISRVMSRIIKGDMEVPRWC